jgi:hypothetical protein
MISGGLMVVAGVIGLVLTRDKDVASDPAQLPEKQIPPADRKE